MRLLPKLLVAAGTAGIVLVAGELVVRRHYGVGPLAGLGADPATSPFVRDDALGYRLSPAHPGIGPLGIRGEHAPRAEAPARARLLVVGDSVAFDEHGFVARLGERLGAEVDVVNGAVPGYTTYQERLLLAELLPALAPDLVVLQYCLNDNHRFLHVLGHDGERLLAQEAWDALAPGSGGWLADLTDQSYLLLELRLRLFVRSRAREGELPWEGNPYFATAWRPESWELVQRELTAMRAACAAAGARLAVVAVPWEPQLDVLASHEDLARAPQRTLGEACERLALPYLDLLDAFAAARAEPLFTDGIHLTERGHDLAATELEAFLAREGLLAAPLSR